MSTPEISEGKKLIWVYYKKWQLGGMNSWGRTLIPNLVRLRKDLDFRLVLSEPPPNGIGSNELPEIMSMDILPLTRFSKLSIFSGAWKLLKRKKVSLAILIEPSVPMGLALRLRSVPFVTTMHSNPISLKGQLQVLLLTHLAQSVLLISEAQKELVTAIPFIRKSRLGRTRNTIEMPSRVTFRRGNKLIRVGVVSRLVEGKGLESLEDILPLLPQHVQLNVFGDGPLKDLVQNSSTNQVVLHGWISELEVIYSDMDVLLVLSHDEVAPTIVLEAAVRGIPVINARALPGIREILGELSLEAVGSSDTQWVPHVVELIVNQEKWPAAKDLHISVRSYAALAVSNAFSTLLPSEGGT